MPLPTLLALLSIFLLPSTYAIIVTTPYPRLSVSRSDDACAADYEACGTAMLAPVRNLPCCSSGFYCYTRGPYFSQCRPSRERQQPPQKSRAQPPGRVRKPLCGLDYGVCSAGNAGSSAIKCCSKEFECKPAPPLYWQCVPHEEKGGQHGVDVKTKEVWAWFRIVPAWLRGKETVVRGEGVLYSFQPGEWAGVNRRGVSVQPVEAMEKVDRLVFRNGSVRGVGAGAALGGLVAVLPVLSAHEIDELVQRVVHAMEGLGVDVVVDGGRLRVTPCLPTFDVAEVAVTLAAFPHILRVELADARQGEGT